MRCKKKCTILFYYPVGKMHNFTLYLTPSVIEFYPRLWYSRLRRQITMQPTNKQIQLAQTIDRFVKTIEKDGGGDTELLVKGFEHMPTLKELLDTSTHEQMDSLCATYPGFYRFAKLLSK